MMDDNTIMANNGQYLSVDPKIFFKIVYAEKGGGSDPQKIKFILKNIYKQLRDNQLKLVIQPNVMAAISAYKLRPNEKRFLNRYCVVPDSNFLNSKSEEIAKLAQLYASSNVFENKSKLSSNAITAASSSVCGTNILIEINNTKMNKRHLSDIVADINESYGIVFENNGFVTVPTVYTLEEISEVMESELLNKNNLTEKANFQNIIQKI